MADTHNLIPSKQQSLMLENSAMRGVRQESSSEVPAPSDGFAPFLGSVWELHYLNSDDSIGESMGTITFADATRTTAKGDSELLDAHGSGGNLCGVLSCLLFYGDTFYYLGALYISTDVEFNQDGGAKLEFTFNCTTLTCDTVVGIYKAWHWEGNFSNKTLDPNYRFPVIGQRLSPSSPSNQSNTPSNNTLPQLGNMAALDTQGTATPTETTCSGGISINGGAYQTQMVQNLSDNVDILGNMTIDPNHVGQAADIFVYAKATLPSSEEVSYFMLGQGLSILSWDQDTAHLAAFQPDIVLGATQVVQIYQGTFFYPGTLKVHFGYRLKDGTLVTHDQPIDITINP